MALLRGDFSVWQVCFIRDEDLGHAWAGMGINLFEPVHDVSERAHLSAVVYQNDSHGAFVVGLRNCSEALLAGRVPNLQLHSLILHVDRLDFEVDA